MPIDLSAKQKIGLEMLGDPNNTVILFTGAARSGKTFLIFEFLVQRAYQFPGCRQLIVREILVDLRASIWDDTAPKYLKMFIPESEYTLQKSELKIIFNNGSEIVFAGLDTELRSQKILGTEYVTIFCNEATQMKYDVVCMLRTRLAQYVLDRTGTFPAVNKLILDCNPRDPKHWLKIYGVDKKDPSTRPYEPLPDREHHAYLHWIPEDNIKYLPPGFIETLDALPFEARERMRWGKWCGGSGAVFKEFNESIHTCTPFEIPRSWARFRAIDFGFNHPFACSYAAYDYATDTIYFYREHKESGYTIDMIADLLISVEKKTNEVFDKTWADHDLSDRMFLQKRGIYTTPAKKSVLDSINAIRQRMCVVAKTQKPRIMIFKTCVNLIDGIFAYEWKPNTSLVSDKDVPVKRDDDNVDTMRYIVYGIDKMAGTVI